MKLLRAFIGNPATRPHFENPFHEYVIEPAGVLV